MEPTTNAQPATKDEIKESLHDLLVQSVSKTSILSQSVKDKGKELKDALLNIPAYRDQAEVVKEASRVKAAQRKEALSRPDLRKLDEELKELRSELKDEREAQSSYATEYHRLTQMTLFDMPDGTSIEIIPEAKLKAHGMKVSIRKRH